MAESAKGTNSANASKEGGADSLARQRRELPDEPGVYIFRDGDRKPLYVGKAKSIRKRVASHFRKPTGRAADLVAAVDQIDFTVTKSEAEALITEDNFIKRYRPYFNIRMRDDKSYPFIGISMDEDFPRVYFTRERHRPGRLYFGPFSSARRVRQALELLGKVFQYRTCEGSEPGRATGNPCLDYYIKRCQAPCVQRISRDEYRSNIGAIVKFLSGSFKEVEAELEQRMASAAQERQYESAATYRDRLAAVRALFSKERVAKESIGSVDFIAVATDAADANGQVFQVRDGVLAGSNSFYLSNEAGLGVGEVVEEFAARYYAGSGAIPPRVVVQREADSLKTLQYFLTARRGAAVAVSHAFRGRKRELLELAEHNARLALMQDKLKQEHSRRRCIEALDALGEALGLDGPPVRIECFDISNLGPQHTVASMAVFESGIAKSAHYRIFNIRREGSQDDFAAMREALSRRQARYLVEHERSPHDTDRDESFASLPALIVIDGGKGQLNAAISATGDLRKRGVAFAGIAKRDEEVFLPGRKFPLGLPRHSPELQLLQRARDEAHRFAIKHHRGRRGRAATQSIFDSLPGVGPARRRLLVGHFGTPEGLTEASREELESIPGLPAKVARDVHAYLHKSG